VADITYIETQEGWLYAAGILDLHSRKVVGLAMDTHLESELVQRALHMALIERRPEPGLLYHSDQGSQYTCWEHQQILDGHQITISMSRRGECLDNAPMESFWGTLKTECADEPFETIAQAKAAIFAYVMGWYNRKRRHSALGYLSPEQFENRQPCLN
jgi:transposase InsO family protein